MIGKIGRNFEQFLQDALKLFEEEKLYDLDWSFRQKRS